MNRMFWSSENSSRWSATPSNGLCLQIDGCPTRRGGDSAREAIECGGVSFWHMVLFPAPPDDPWWKRRLPKNPVIVGACITGLCGIVAAVIVRASKPVVLPTSLPAPTIAAPPPLPPRPDSSRPASPAQEAPLRLDARGRAFLSDTSTGSLYAQVDAAPPLQREEVARRRFLGNWIRLHVPVRGLGVEGQRIWLVVEGSWRKGIGTLIWFPLSAKRELMDLREGDTVTVDARIDSIGEAGSLILRRGELVGRKQP